MRPLRVACALPGDPTKNGTAPEAEDRSGETAPRAYLFDEMFCRRYDESILEDSDASRSELLKRMPRLFRVALEVHRRRSEYDVIVTWNEKLSLSLMAIQRFSNVKKPHIAMMYWFSKPNVRLPMLAFGHTIKGIITWSSVQYAFARKQLHIPAHRIFLIKHFVDQLFWQPRGCPTDRICAVGNEMRDYSTLVEALRGTEVPCHIAADHVRINRLVFGRRISTETLRATVPSNISIGRKTISELRDLYARSRFVVVPLCPSDTDNGVTVILEAMAMGKAVICSRTKGQVDVIEDGVTGVFVPVADPVALRDAIVSLWKDPRRAEEMGARARAYIEQHHTLDKFCNDVRSAIEAVARDQGYNEGQRHDSISGARTGLTA